MTGKDQTINVRIDPALKKAFQDACKNNHDDMSRVLTRAIVEYVRNAPPPLKLKRK